MSSRRSVAESTSTSPVDWSSEVDSTNEISDSQAVLAVAARIRERATALGISQASLARGTGIPKQSIAGYWHGSQAVGADRLFALSDALDVSPRWLLLGIQEQPVGEQARITLRKALEANLASQDVELVEVEEIDFSYGLGGTFSDDQVEVRKHQFPRAWIEAITRTPPAMLTFARGRGDSMMPTITDGDMILIDRSIRTVREQDALWALTIGEIAMVKRVRSRGERVLILSDNDRVPADDVHHEEINIIGRVIFIGRRT